MTSRVSILRGNVSISALATGRMNGPAILLSNSLGASLEMWEPQRELLEKHYKVIGYDTRGHGQSSTPAGAYSFDDLTADAIAVLDHFKIEKADYIGLSLGGMTGIGLGLDHSERFNKIVCACARTDSPQLFVTSWDDRVSAIADGGMPAIWPGTIARWFTEDFVINNPKLVSKLADEFMQTTVVGYTGCARALQTLDYKRRLAEMTTPVQYISGANDLGAASSEMYEMWISTPNSNYHDIPDCAHIANLNQATDFNRIIKKFLEL
jgi:3-oxoadipate enol-lactonase